MSTLMICNVDPGLKEKSRVRAACRGHSMEAELRVILSDALAKDHLNGQKSGRSHPSSLRTVQRGRA